MGTEVKTMYWQRNGYTIRPAEAADAEAYYHALFDPIDPEVARLTGSAAHYPKDIVIPFFLRCIADETRHDFLILDPKGRIIGESVINEFNPADNSANYRIAIAGSANRNHGVGTWALQCACEFAFESLHLTRLTLSVLDCNPRAQHMYQKCGFEPFDREDDEILMELTHPKWLPLR